MIVVAFACNTKTQQQSGILQPSGKAKVDQLIFGRFCGMCPKGCAIMYQLDAVRNEMRVDTSERYFKSEGKELSFSTKPLSEKSFLTAREIMDQLPDSLLMAPDNERFGCPDCADGCGIYLRLTSGTVTKSFYIDYQTDQLSGYIKPYAELIRKKFEEVHGL